MNIRRAVWLSAVASYSSLFAQFLAIVFVTRVLTPTEMGSYAVAIALFNILRPFADFGLTRYVVQLDSIQKEDLRAVSTIGWAIGLTVGALTWVFADTFANYFKSATIAPTLRVMTATITLYPFVLVSGALLARDMRQDRLALANAANSFVQAATSISCVYSGYGIVSLGVGYLAGLLVQYALLAIFGRRSALVLPGTCGLGRVFRSGLNMAGITIVSQIGNSAPDALIGRLLSLAEAGIYSRSVAIVGILRRGLDAVIAAVALPSFSQTLREGGDPRDAYIKAVELSSGLIWPLLGVLIVLAEPLVDLLYGGRWYEVVPISRYVALMSFVIPITTFATPLLVSLRKENVLFLVELLGQSVKVLAVFACAHFSLDVVAGGLAATSLIQTGVVIAVLHHVVLLPVHRFRRAAIHSLVVTLATSVGCALVLVTSVERSWAQLVVGLAGAGVAWSFAVWVTRHPLRLEIAATLDRMVSIIKEKR